MNIPVEQLLTPGRRDVGQAPEGADVLFAARLLSDGRDVLFVLRDDAGLARRAAVAAFFAPDADIIELPAWDCLPYDRVSPRRALVGRRLAALGRLSDGSTGGRLILTTVSALLQRVPPRDFLKGAGKELNSGTRIEPDDLVRDLERFGFNRIETVTEPGEYAVRGGIVDVYPAGAGGPVRLDFFGDELDTLRTFDPATQRSTGEVASVVLTPVSEAPLDEDAVSRFRTNYREMFQTAGSDDPLYEAISEGRRHQGFEHWLPLFHDKLETLFDYLPDAAVLFDHQAGPALQARRDLIAEYYTARQTISDADSGVPYRPVNPDLMFVNEDTLDAGLKGRSVSDLSPYETGGTDIGAAITRDYADVRIDPNANVYEAVADDLRRLAEAGSRTVVACFSEGSQERLKGLLAEHGAPSLRAAERDDAKAGEAVMAVIGLDRGFTFGDLAVITESDMLGERMARPGRRRIRPENFIAEVSSLTPGDLVVHVDHGIGQFLNLETIEVGGAPHDCLQIGYAGDAKLFLPVENVDLLTRYGSEDAGVQLDRLGGAAWQARRAKLKERVREMADELIKIAAARELKTADKFIAPEGAYDEFAARFPFNETDDQLEAIRDVLGDLQKGRPTDRLVCGDVGFGKTEVALRAAFAVAMEGKQVAVVVPTTLLCRQHYMNFAERFRGFPVRVRQLSRMVTQKEMNETKEGMKKGDVDIVIGTHALLAKDVAFRDLGLLIVDEEQHFGVAHKERLKALRADVHVLTLTATPIPRTLQMALTGIREMSLIATPPVDRLAVRTFVLPFDPVIVREAILREQYRGGQTFYVCPRINDLEKVADRLRELVPEAKVAMVHGQMPVSNLEDIISRFYDGAYDVLLSTNIIESGLDLPAVNTIIIHRADMFGLAQLYQLRGRVGRSKTRAYAYLTLPPGQLLTKAAEKRLEVMQTLDSLGAGFTLASHDLDIRGAGNLLGDEQSGHIREVGIELYQQMLEEAVAEARGMTENEEMDWSPQVALGMPVLIPDWYVPDLTVRMGLYRRIAWLKDADEIEQTAAEMIDRFGPIPSEAENLLEVVKIKQLCRRAGIAKLDAGPKGAVVQFHNDQVRDPAKMVEWITAQKGTAKLRPDYKLVFSRSWDTPKERMKGLEYLAGDLATVNGADT
ncbi:MAG: transcription-repair coupling factor [Rhodospirillales bacterium]|nr:transcription-repair coupling factor [Rhodospirillales bacterium]MBO6786931.1 transcription-repair coupling factor [Rhodospirillales bacterium]